MSGTLRAIAIAPRKREALHEVPRVEVTVPKGITGDARGHFPGRQVTIVFEDAWRAACTDLGRDLPWTTRRANLLVGGMDAPQTVGARLRVGPVLLEITEETAPCQIMERAAKGLRAALTPAWRGGVSCTVIEGGEIAIGDRVEIAGSAR